MAAKGGALSFPQALTSARKHLGVTKAGLARRLGLHPTTIARWERDRFLPDRADRERLLSALAGAPPELERAMRAALGLGSASAAVGSHARLVLDSAVLAMAEHLPPATPAALRAALAAALDRLAAHRIELPAARAALG